MKKHLLFFLLAICGLVAKGQNTPTEPPYKRYPTVPPMNLLLQDSASYFTKDDLKKNKKTIIILFSPDCDHCQHEARELVKNKEALKDVQVIFSGTAPLQQLSHFYKEYGLSALPHVVMGKDHQYILPSFYQMKNFPFFALYNKKQQLIKTFEGAYPIQQIIDALN